MLGAARRKGNAFLFCAPFGGRIFFAGVGGALRGGFVVGGGLGFLGLRLWAGRGYSERLGGNAFLFCVPFWGAHFFWAGWGALCGEGLWLGVGFSSAEFVDGVGLFLPAREGFLVAVAGVDPAGVAGGAGFFFPEGCFAF